MKARAGQTDEQIALRRQKNARRQAEKRAKETEEQTALRRIKARESQTARRAKETEQQAALRKRKNAERQAARRARLCVTQTNREILEDEEDEAQSLHSPVSTSSSSSEPSDTSTCNFPQVSPQRRALDLITPYGILAPIDRPRNSLPSMAPRRLF